MAVADNFGLHPRLPLAAANQNIVLSIQIAKELRALSSALYWHQLMVR